MTVHFDKSRGKWRYNFQLKGERHQGYCIHPDTRQSAQSKKEARDIEALARRQLTHQPLSPLVPACTLAQAVSYYSKNIGQYLADWPTQRARLRELLDFFGYDRDVCTIQEEDIAAYVSWARVQTVKVNASGPVALNDNRKFKDTGRKRTPRTINGYLRLLLRVLQVPVAKKGGAQPPEMPYLQVPKRTPAPIEQRAAERILQHAAPHLQRVIVLAVNTGMREREILGARDHQFNEQQRAIYLIEDTKARTGRLVPLNDIAYSVALQCRADGDKLWSALQADEKAAARYKRQWGIETRGDIPMILYAGRGKAALLRPIGRTKASWRGAKARAGIHGRIRFHDTRASFCSYLAAEGADPFVIQQLAGHRDINTTMLYVKAGGGNLHQTVALLSDKRPLKIPEAVTHESHSRAEQRKRKNGTK